MSATARASSFVFASWRALSAVTPLELADESRRRDLGEPAREEVVPGVAAGDADHVAAQAEVLDVLAQNHVHC